MAGIEILWCRTALCKDSNCKLDASSNLYSQIRVDLPLCHVIAMHNEK